MPVHTSSSTTLTAGKWWGIVALGIALSLLMMSAALSCGVMHITPAQHMAVVVHKLHLAAFVPVPTVDDQTTAIVWDVRLKRIVLAYLVGAALAMSGCIFQALLRNPLADPHILGVSSGGALGAVSAAVAGVTMMITSVVAIPLCSFAGSLLAMGIVYVLSKRKGSLSLYSLLLVGVILNSFFISIVIFIETRVESDQLASIFFWLLGSLAHPDEHLMNVLAVVSVVAGGVLLGQTRALNLVSISEDKAAEMGVPVERVKTICYVASSLMTGLAVALSGLVGFVGLVVPHVVRLIVGPDHRCLLPGSAFMGGIFLVIADTAARTLLAPQELPVGVVTSFVGAPFFIVLLKLREKKRIW